jgi:uncharacterized protein with HEPN domain
MSCATIDRLRDIIQSAELARQHASDLSAKGLATAASRRDAALFRLVVICEAATKLPVEVQALAPEIDWPSIRGMRNILVHDYWQIDLEIVVEAIAADLPPLTAAVRRLIDMMSREEE